MFWLKNILAEKNDRKYILLMHVSPGARYKDKAMWKSYPNNVYFDILKEYSDKIILEIGGHDHLSSLRYHTKRDILDVSSSNALQHDELFHNIFIAPSMTPWYHNNPDLR